jgi:hypothetical protein
MTVTEMKANNRANHLSMFKEKRGGGGGGLCNPILWL